MSSPYREEENHAAVATADLFGKYHLPEPPKKKLVERNELLDYFKKRTGDSIPLLCGKLWWVGYDQNGVKDSDRELRDLYYVKSDCDQAADRGVPWGAAFNKILERVEGT